MPVSRRNVAIVAVLAVVSGWLLTRSDNEDPADRIRQAIRHTIEAAEAQDLGGIMDVVSKHFTARNKGFDRDGLKGMLYFQLRRGAWRKIFLTDAEIDLDDSDTPTRAEVRLEALLAAGKEVKSITDILPTNAAKYRFDLVFAREDDDEWRVIAADYKQLPISGL